jgi:hypothetical protein
MDDELTSLTSTTPPTTLEGEMFQPETISLKQIIPSSVGHKIFILLQELITIFYFFG